jgi:hypothetical protein
MLQPEWPYQQPDATVAMPPHLGRRRIALSELMPYFVACIALAAATAALVLFLSWRTGVQAQVSRLRREVASTQAHLASTQARLARDASAGGSQFSRLNGSVRGLRTDVNAVSGLAPYTGECTVDATGPSGVAVYALPCRP